MTQATPIHDYLAPRVAALVQSAAEQGMARDAVVAVLIDILTSPQYDTAAPDPAADSAPHQDWDRSHHDVVLVEGAYVANVPTIGVQHEDDFVAPLTYRD
jgi:hypothetical protein